MSEILVSKDCSNDNFRIGKQGSIWDNATWASPKFKCRGSLRFLKKKCIVFFLQLCFV
jgi:hypothetical protein